MSGFRAGAVRLGDDYERVRDDARRDLAGSKEALRVQLAEDLALVFENPATVRAATEESLRSERVSAEETQSQVDAFTAVAPVPGQLTAVLLLDSDDAAALGDTAARLLGVQRCVRLELDGVEVRGIPAESRGDAPAHLLRFDIPTAQRHAASMTVVVDHAECQARIQLDDEQRRAVLEEG